MEKIGFIGLGIMGKPMALHLLKAGYEVSVLEKNKASGELVAAGAVSFPTASDIAQNSDVVITMLPESDDVVDVLSHTSGVLNGIRQGSLFIDMSTIEPSSAKSICEWMREKGVDALDAPVSGGQAGAEAATLSIMAGGSVQGFQRALPIFQVMGKNIVLVGGPGSGQMTKACNQMIVGMTIQAVAEAFTLAQKAGLDLEKMREVLLGGFAQSRILDLHGKRIIDRNFAPGFRIRLHRKDMGIALATGKELSVPLYGTSQVAAQMDALLAQGKGDLDHSAIALLMEQLAGI